MKKIIAAALTLILIISFAACKAPVPTPMEPTAAPTAEPTETPTAEPAESSDPIDPAIIDAAWTVAQKLEQVHLVTFDKAGAMIMAEYSIEVRFPCVTQPDEVLIVSVEKDDEGNYKPNAESVYMGCSDEDALSARFDKSDLEMMLVEFSNAEIKVTADDVRAFGCEAVLSSHEYMTAAVAAYGEKLATYYRERLTEDSPFCCYDVRCVGTEVNEGYDDSYNILIGFRFRDILLGSYLFDYVPLYDSGMLHPDYEGWFVGWTLVEVKLGDDGSFTHNAVLNGAG